MKYNINRFWVHLQRLWPSYCCYDGKYWPPHEWSCKKKMHSNTDRRKWCETWLITNKKYHHPKYVL